MSQTVSQVVAERESAPATVTPKAALTQLLEQNKGAVGASLPSGYSADRFVRLLLTAANTNPDLFTCDQRSFLAAGVAAAQLGLEPNDARGLAYLLPFKDKRRGKIVQLIIGYKGMLDLARRSGMVSSINAFAVFDGDRFEYSLGLDPSLHHVPGDHDEDPAKLTHVYAVAKVNGDAQFVVMTRRQVLKVMASSQSAKSDYSPWNTHFTEMALKTALRRLCKWLPQTVEAARVVDAEERGLDLGSMFMGGEDVGHIDHDPDDAVEVNGQPVNPETGELAAGGPA
jgi:recombination protein RecT